MSRCPLRPETTLPAQHHSRPYLIQWERTLRWRQRVAATGDGPDTFDFLFALFMSIFHMRDWIAASRRDLEKNVATLFSSSANLSLARDVANSVKHMETTQYRVDGAATVAREYAGSGQHRYVLPRPGGGNLECLALADKCIAEIQDFLQTNDLL